MVLAQEPWSSLISSQFLAFRSGNKLTHSELFTRNIVDDSLPILHCYMKTELVADTTKLTYLYR